MIDSREKQIIDFIQKIGECSSKEIFDETELSVSYATLKRLLTKLITSNYISTKGRGKGTKYLISPTYQVIQPIDVDKYYEKEIDERKIKKGFNFQILNDVLAKHSVFTDSELQKLNNLQKIFQNNISQLSDKEYKKEFERLAIDLSWKSSQIEGNTYSLLEAERLLK